MNAFLGSVRGRLTLHSLLVTAPVVAGLLIALYFGALSAFEAQDRTVVREEAESAMQLLAARPDLAPEAALAPLLNEVEGREEQHLWLGQGGTPLLARPAGFAPQALPPERRWPDPRAEEERLQRCGS